MKENKKGKPLIWLIIHLVALYCVNQFVPILFVPIIYAIICLYYAFAQFRKDAETTGLEKFLAIILIIYAGFCVIVQVLAFFALLGIFAIML